MRFARFTRAPMLAAQADGGVLGKSLRNRQLACGIQLRMVSSHAPPALDFVMPEDLNTISLPE